MFHNNIYSVPTDELHDLSYYSSGSCGSLGDLSCGVATASGPCSGITVPGRGAGGTGGGTGETTSSGDCIVGVVDSELHSHVLFKPLQGVGSFSHSPVSNTGGEFGFNIIHGDIRRVQGPVRVINQTGVDWFVKAHNIIRQSQLPNHRLARIHVKSSLNIPNWELYLSDYFDKQVIDFLQFGFPLSVSRQGFVHLEGSYNHSTAIKFDAHVTKYFDQELQWWGIMGPFDNWPLSAVHTSPLLTRSKDIDDRRVIVDLSYPPYTGLNHWVDSKFDGVQYSLTYPSVDMIAQRVAQLGPSALIYKIDLKRAFRNLKVDPGDCDMLGLTWEGKKYIDTSIPFGYLHGSACCQRVTDAIRYICNSGGYWVCNYVDDFMGVELPSKAHEAYQFLLKLLSELGLPISMSKLVSPQSKVTCLGIEVDAIYGTISINPEKLASIHVECLNWSSKNKATPTQMQSLLGKLLYIAKCVAPARLFLGRMLTMYRACFDCHSFQLTDEFFRDLNWFIKLLMHFNGVVFVKPLATQLELHVDASLHGIGAIFGTQVYASPLPQYLNPELGIVQLEMLNVLVAFRLWAHTMQDQKLKIYCDNAAVVSVLSSGRSRDAYLLACARNIWAITASHNIKFDIAHIAGKKNIIPDILSRWYTPAKFDNQHIEFLRHHCEWLQLLDHHFYIDWSI